MNLFQRFYISPWHRRVNVAIHILALPICAFFIVWASIVYPENSLGELFFDITFGCIAILILLYLTARLQDWQEPRNLLPFWGPGALPRKYSLSIRSSAGTGYIDWSGEVYNAELKIVGKREGMSSKAGLICKLVEDAQKNNHVTRPRRPEHIYIGPMAKQLAKQDQERLLGS